MDEKIDFSKTDHGTLCILLLLAVKTIKRRVEQGSTSSVNKPIDHVLWIAEELYRRESEKWLDSSEKDRKLVDQPTPNEW